MFPGHDSDLLFRSNQSLKKEITIDTAIEELERGMSQPDAVVNSRVWQIVPLLLRDNDLVDEKNERQMGRLIQSILRVLNECSKNGISIINRRMLHSSLSTLAKSPSLPKMIRVGIDQCLASLDSFEDSPFVLVDFDEFKSMESAALHNSQTASTQKEGMDTSSHNTITLRRQLKDDEEKLRKEREERREAEEKAKRAKEREQASETARREAELARKRMEEEKKKREEDSRRMEEEKKKREEDSRRMEEEKKQKEEERRRMEEEKMEAEEESRRMPEEERRSENGREKMERMRAMMRTEWSGTESLQTVDRTAHTLTSTTLTQIASTPHDNPWRTAFTFQINEGEWELKIRRSDQTGPDVMLGFLRHPLPQNATQRHCGSYFSEIGGNFSLWSGGMWKGGEFKPAGTNKKWERIRQTAAIRVNMRTREARLFVDDEEQPGIFPDIPSPLCLGISTRDQNKPIEVLHLVRTDITCQNKQNNLLSIENTIDTSIEELERGIEQPEAIVNSGVWQNIPNLLRDGDMLEKKNIPRMEKLIQSILQILNECSKNDIPLVNRRMLHSSLSTLATSSTPDKTIRDGVDRCLASLDSVKDGPSMLVDANEFKSMEDAVLDHTQTSSNQKEEIGQLSNTIATLQRQLKDDEEKLRKEREERKEAEAKLERAKEREHATEIAIRGAETRIEQLLIELQNAENNLKESKENEKRVETNSTPPHASRDEFVKALRRIKPESIRGKRIVTFTPDISVERTMQAFSSLTTDELLGSFIVTIEGTSAIDTNGLKSWYFTKLVERLMDPDDQRLFVVDGHSDGRMMIANDSQTRSLEFLKMYRFVGVVLGKMLLEGIPVPFRFNEFIWKQLRGDAAVASDLSLANPNLVTGLSGLLSFSEDDLTKLELHWTTTLPDGTNTELIPEGETKIVRHSDWALFHDLAAGAVLQWYSPQLMAMRAGLTSLVPPDVLRMLSPQELELAVCGEDTIDVAKWKEMTKYSDALKTRGDVADAFWEVVETSSDQVRREIIRLACGTTSLRILPLTGQPSFTLHLLNSDGFHLPEGHTCFNRLDIPKVTDVDLMRTLITKAINNKAPPND
ncbi:putative E3 ubiquitin-protein ligase SMURF1 [Blattamonas nauphoetae]|uniref:HECT-type E3 ubiquitin transferase n=1 Tax=Blattamonas nauphoetae TaxID=2049346 RepID=A0ABQ9YB84_9EUKA|nr:putative E3 ubiquitin-protein ligase SMURF1 [Blattamonas nauphoetae]